MFREFLLWFVVFLWFEPQITFSALYSGYRVNEQHTGYENVTLKPSSKFALKLRWESDKFCSNKYRLLFAESKLICINITINYLMPMLPIPIYSVIGLNVTNGDMLWMVYNLTEYQVVGYQQMSSPTYCEETNSVVIIQSNSGHLYNININNGSLIHSIPTSKPIYDYGEYLVLPVARNEYKSEWVYFIRSFIFKFNTKTGTLIPDLKFVHEGTSITICNNIGVVATDCAETSAFDINTFEPLWYFEPGPCHGVGAVTPPLCIENYKLNDKINKSYIIVPYFYTFGYSNHTGYCYVLDASNGSLQFTFHCTSIPIYYPKLNYLIYNLPYYYANVDVRSLIAQKFVVFGDNNISLIKMWTIPLIILPDTYDYFTYTLNPNSFLMINDYIFFISWRSDYTTGDYKTVYIMDVYNITDGSYVWQNNQMDQVSGECQPYIMEDVQDGRYGTINAGYDDNNVPIIVSLSCNMLQVFE
eukprot:27537_1